MLLLWHDTEKEKEKKTTLVGSKKTPVDTKTPK